MENGEIPNDINWVGQIVQDVCFNNNKNYFNWQLDSEPKDKKLTA
jgi:glucuronate isomerase